MSRVVALSGGIGGAKLALGLARVLAPQDLTVVVNTGDDFNHLGLHISPDVDTTLYTLAGIANPDLGWGRRDETWQFMRTLGELGGPTWFQLGDADLALHVARTQALANGRRMAEVTADLAHRLGVGPRVLPMSDDPVRTRVVTSEGELDFQHYFVARRCEPVVIALRYDGASDAQPAPGLLAALASPQLEAVILCPSNPWLSMAPMLAIPALRHALSTCAAPVVAVSPLVGGRAVKGPTGKIMAELGLPVAADQVARYYGDLLDGFVLDERDRVVAPQLGTESLITDTLMRDLADRERLARETLALAARLSRQKAAS